MPSRGGAAVVRFLDRLPWPLGEECFAVGLTAKALVDPTRRSNALAWASKHADGELAQWRLALDTMRTLGRFMAINCLIGAERPNTLRRHLVIHGRTHLDAAIGRGPVLLLGFHLGPPGAFLALRLLGYRLTFIGAADAVRFWPRRRGWTGLLEDRDTIPLTPGDAVSAARALHVGHRVLQQGGTVFILGDGGLGPEVFRVSVPGKEVVMRSGWFTMRRLSGATTLPVLCHLHGRQRVLEVFPPLPAPVRDIGADREMCGTHLMPIVSAYVRARPAQCLSLAD